MNEWAVAACSAQGHVQAGVGNGTGRDDVIWSDHCDRCGTELPLTEAHEVVSVPPKRTVRVKGRIRNVFRGEPRGVC